MRAALIAFAAGAALLILPVGPAGAAYPADPVAGDPEPAARAGAEAGEVLACRGNCGVNRRVSRRTSRRTSRRVSNRNDYYRGGGGYYGRPGVVVYDDDDNTAAVGIAAGVVGLAVGAAIANSATGSAPSGDYPH